MIGYALLALFLILIVRLLGWAYMRSCLKTSKYRKAIEGKSFINRWFFVSLRNEIKDRFSKCENRLILHSITAQMFYWMNISNHFLYFVYLFSVFISTRLFHGHSNNVFQGLSIIFYAVMLLEILMIAIATGTEDRRYHKERMRNSKLRRKSRRQS